MKCINDFTFHLRKSISGKLSVIIFLILMAAGSNNPVLSQVYPVSTVTSVTPPYPTSLDGFTDQAASKITLQIVVNDVTLTNHPVKLRMVMKSSINRISTSSSLILQPIYINGGETMVLSAADLATYFRPEYLDFSGFSKSQYLRTGQLPDGIYQVSFEVLDYQRNFVISSSIPAFVYLFVNDPPLLNTPQSARQIEITGQQNIVFNWSFRHSPFTSPGFQPEYQLDIWEIYPDNLDPYAVVKASQPVFSERIRNTSFQYSDLQPQLIPGRKYAWRVRAVDPQNIAAFKENGYSEVRWFKYGTACDAPVLKGGKSGTNNANVEWATPQLQKDFIIRYRPEQPSDAPWYTAKTSFLSHKLENLRPNTSYIVEVSGKCGSQESPVSNQITLRTNMDLNFQCGGKGNIAQIENRVPIPHLQKGNFIKAGDFEVEVYQVQGENGIFNGKGYVLVPLFNFIKLDAVLENVQVNSDFQLIGGSIRTIYDVNNSAMVNATDIVNSIISDTKPETNDFAEIDIVKINAGDSITSITIANNEVTVRTADGNKRSEKIDSARLIAVTAPSGHQYVVDGVTKTVYTSSSPGGAAPKTERLNNPDAENSRYNIEFAAHPSQSYGFDSVPANPAGKWYESKEIGGKQVYLPWKSVNSGGYDKLIARIEGKPADSVFFARESASMVMAAPGKSKNEKQLMITGQGNRDEDQLFAWYKTTTGDTAKKETNWLAGAVNVVSYEKKTVNLELVEVNDANAPDAKYIQEQLNQIYKPAIIEWQVTKYSQKLPVTFPNGIFDNDDPDEDMDYTESEKETIKEFKDSAYQKNKLYLFVIGEDVKNKSLRGYMPLNRQFGFIFSKDQRPDELIRTIAHEPGHGAFRLRHTFSEKNSYIEPPYTTDNLMDYTQTTPMQKTRLAKYQWDECHDWDLGVNWGEEEEEGANMNSTDSINTSAKLLKLLYEIRMCNIKDSNNLDVYNWCKINEFTPSSFKINSINKKLKNIHFRFIGDTLNNGIWNINSSIKNIETTIHPDTLLSSKSFVKYSFKRDQSSASIFEIIILTSDSSIFTKYLFPRKPAGYLLGDPIPNPVVTITTANPQYGFLGCVRISNTTCSYPDSFKYTGKNKKHDGTDFTIEVGDTVYSIFSGVVQGTPVTSFEPQNSLYINDVRRDYRGLLSDQDTTQKYTYTKSNGQIINDSLPKRTAVGWYGCHYKENSYGNTVVIKAELDKPINDIYGNSKTTIYIRYTHMNSISVTNGQRVEQGDMVGIAGCSGNAARIDRNQHHVHIEANSTNAWTGIRDIDVLKLITTNINRPRK